MIDITPQTIADRLQKLAGEMLDIAAEMDYFGGFSLIGLHGKELAGAALCAQSWADGIREDWPADADAEPDQPTDREALQATGTHPAPCARHCESNAYTLEARRISAERDALAARLKAMAQDTKRIDLLDSELTLRIQNGRLVGVSRAENVSISGRNSIRGDIDAFMELFKSQASEIGDGK